VTRSEGIGEDVLLRLENTAAAVNGNTLIVAGQRPVRVELEGLPSGYGVTDLSVHYGNGAIRITGNALKRRESKGRPIRQQRVVGHYGAEAIAAGALKPVSGGLPSLGRR
jgi:hypothetical protein